jgi:hypothetical protein
VITVPYPEAFHSARWWRIVARDGSLWCETSDRQEALDRMRPEDTPQRLYTYTLEEWRDQ